MMQSPDAEIGYFGPIEKAPQVSLGNDVDGRIVRLQRNLSAETRQWAREEYQAELDELLREQKRKSSGRKMDWRDAFLPGAE